MELKKKSLYIFSQLAYICNNFLNPKEINKSFNLYKEFISTKISKKYINKFISLSLIQKKKL